jgi:hypothetical protein
MALGFSSGLLTGLQQYGQGGGAIPADPRQRDAMQAAGVTNPLLQQFGKSIGGMFGVDTRSPQQQEQAMLRGLDLKNEADLQKVSDFYAKRGETDRAFAYQQRAEAARSRNSAEFETNRKKAYQLHVNEYIKAVQSGDKQRQTEVSEAMGKTFGDLWSVSEQTKARQVADAANEPERKEFISTAKTELREALDSGNSKDIAAKIADLQGRAATIGGINIESIVSSELQINRALKSITDEQSDKAFNQVVYDQLNAEDQNEAKRYKNPEEYGVTRSNKDAIAWLRSEADEKERAAAAAAKAKAGEEPTGLIKDKTVFDDVVKGVVDTLIAPGDLGETKTANVYKSVDKIVSGLYSESKNVYTADEIRKNVLEPAFNEYKDRLAEGDVKDGFWSGSSLEKELRPMLIKQFDQFKLEHEAKRRGLL